MTSNATLSIFKEQQTKILNVLKKLSDFIQKGQDFGLNVDTHLLKKLKDAIHVTDTGMLKVALIGGFSEGKTSIAAAWLERLDKSMNISQQESSNEVKIYNVDNKIQLVDTPGLFGFKEQHNSSGEIEKYKDLTKKYVSEAHLVLYVMNASNPIKDSHTEDLQWLFRELNLLPRTVFVLSRFDEVVDIEDDWSYRQMLETKKDNVSSRLKQILQLNDVETDNLKIVAVSANPFGKGTDYWLSHLEEFKKISRISTLQDATSKTIEENGSNQDIILQTQKSMLTDVLNKQLPVVHCNQQIIDEELVNLSNFSEQLNQQLTPLELNIDNARGELIRFVREYFGDLVVQLNNTDLSTFQDFYDRAIGKDGMFIEATLNERFLTYTQSIELSVNSIQLKLDAEIASFQNKLGASSAILSQGLSFLSKQKVSNTQILAGRDSLQTVAKTLGVDLGKYLKFKPWGATNLATKLNAVFAVVGLAMEAFDSYKKAQEEEKFQELKQEIKTNLEEQCAGLLNNLSSKEYINSLFPTYQKIKADLRAIQEAKEDTQNRKQRFDDWVQEGNVIDVEFRELR